MGEQDPSRDQMTIGRRSCEKLREAANAAASGKPIQCSTLAAALKQASQHRPGGVVDEMWKVQGSHHL